MSSGCVNAFLCDSTKSGAEPEIVSRPRGQLYGTDGHELSASGRTIPFLPLCICNELFGGAFAITYLGKKFPSGELISSTIQRTIFDPRTADKRQNRRPSPIKSPRVGRLAFHRICGTWSGGRRRQKTAESMASVQSTALQAAICRGGRPQWARTSLLNCWRSV